MVAGDHKFHPECFCCSSCSGFIGDGEAYALVERSKLYCGQCYKRQMRPLLGRQVSSSGSGKPQHSIRLVEIPPVPVSQSGPRTVKLSLEGEGVGAGTYLAPHPIGCRGLRISEWVALCFIFTSGDWLYICKILNSLLCNWGCKMGKFAASWLHSTVAVCFQAAKRRY